MRSPLRVGLMVAILVAGTTVGALAGDGWAGPCAADYGCWGGYPGWASYDLDSVPYFALHPPVYYSYPVPRPYGYSPFAYPPGTPTPVVAPPQPQIVPNPFVPQPSSTTVKPERSAALPLRIHNPFVAQNDAEPIPAEWSDSPQVVYPAKLSRTF